MGGVSHPAPGCKLREWSRAISRSLRPHPEPVNGRQLGTKRVMSAEVARTSGSELDRADWRWPNYCHRGRISTALGLRVFRLVSRGLLLSRRGPDPVLAVLPFEVTP